MELLAAIFIGSIALFLLNDLYTIYMQIRNNDHRTPEHLEKMARLASRPASDEWGQQRYAGHPDYWYLALPPVDGTSPVEFPMTEKNKQMVEALNEYNETRLKTDRHYATRQELEKLSGTYMQSDEPVLGDVLRFVWTYSQYDDPERKTEWLNEQLQKGRIEAPAGFPRDALTCVVDIEVPHFGTTKVMLIGIYRENFW